VTDHHFRQAAGAKRAGQASAPQSALPADLARFRADLPEHVKAAIRALAASGAESIRG